MKNEFPSSPIPSVNRMATDTYECRDICNVALTDFFELKVTLEVESVRDDYGKEKSCQHMGVWR